MPDFSLLFRLEKFGEIHAFVVVLWPGAGMASVLVSLQREQVRTLDPGTVQVAGVVLVSVQV